MIRAFYRERPRDRVHLVTLQEAEERFERALFHEAGHVAVALAVGIRVKRVRVDADHAVTTRVRNERPLDRSETERRVAHICAGYLAERRRFRAERGWARRCAETDFRDVAVLVAGGGDASALVGLRLAWRALAEHWRFVVALADLLRARGEALETELVDVAVAHGVDVEAIDG